ncbi:MAG: hypothetical protein R3Y67_09790 [Eubacteriales bacterium]
MLTIWICNSTASHVLLKDTLAESVLIASGYNAHAVTFASYFLHHLDKYA